MVIVEFEDDHIKENLHHGYGAFPSGANRIPTPSVQSGSTFEDDKKMSARIDTGTQSHDASSSFQSGSSIDEDDSKISVRPGAYAVASTGISLSKSGHKVDDENLKMTLAMRTSQVSVPGAFQDIGYDAAQEKSKHDFQDTSNYRRLKAAQKSRGYCDNELHGPERASLDEEEVLDDFNQRMNSFQQDTEKNNAKEDENLAKRARCRLVVLIVVILIVLSVVVGVVVGVVTKNADATQPASSVTQTDKCDTRPINEQSARFKAFHTELLSQSPDMAEALNTEWSAARASLCWLADSDSFQVDTDSDFFPRFLAALIYYHFVGVASPGESRKRPSTLSGWLSDAPVCEWQGITCDSEKGSITSLDLNSMQLKRTSIPTELFLLTSLVEVSLSENEITGRIPDEIMSLSQLKTFDLANNKITGQIPSDLFGRQLEYIDLLGNSFTGTLPAKIADATSLTHIAISGFDVTGTLPDLSGLTNLKALALKDLLGVEGKFPNVSTCSNLESLILEGTGFSGTLPTYLFSLSNLEALSLQFNLFTGSLSTEIGQLSRLKILAIVNHSLDGAIPTEIGLLSHLETLYITPSLTKVVLSGTLPTEVCSFPNLTDIVLTCSQCSCCKDCLSREQVNNLQI